MPARVSPACGPTLGGTAVAVVGTAFPGGSGTAMAGGSAYRCRFGAPDAPALVTMIALPVLMLARVDGKSPVEYLSDANRNRVRALAVDLIFARPARLAAFVAWVDHHLTGDTS